MTETVEPEVIVNSKQTNQFTPSDTGPQKLAVYSEDGLSGILLPAQESQHTSMLHPKCGAWGTWITTSPFLRVGETPTPLQICDLLPQQ